MEVENKYKKYTNKFTAILQIAKQDYYSKLLDRNKKNMKGIWNLSNNIIKKNYQRNPNNNKTNKNNRFPPTGGTLIIPTITIGFPLPEES